ncbi:MAG TPA: hypothetical protein DEG18_02410 [Candidatus Yanofskybacteria bacterium]|nr:MAG: hypothetical protein A2241_00385 [Candidatus Yanofskybacteria bacterium RIFOXYA2_FULL_45_28]OGN38707.1 MAG: hypothetical protein A2371_03105 [Candidatus Yanofskybacteria bacterium RIFOXYB1_FULL_44_29]HBX58437.1 hypothetical protein [Candidatus Yanofskybacteria bacterium]
MTAGLKKHILIQYPAATPLFREPNLLSLLSSRERACYALWMLDYLQTLTSGDPITAAARRGRWMGYVNRELEVLGVITNDEIRTLMRLDLDNPQ